MYVIFVDVWQLRTSLPPAPKDIQNQGKHSGTLVVLLNSTILFACIMKKENLHNVIKVFLFKIIVKSKGKLLVTRLLLTIYICG